MKEQRDILGESSFYNNNYSNLSEIEKLFHKEFIADGGIMFKNDNDHLYLVSTNRKYEYRCH